MLKTIFNHIDQDQNQKILLEQVKILYQILLPILIISLVVSSALVYGLWNVTSQTVLTVWMSLMLIVLILRAIYFFIYQRHSKPEKVQKDAMYYVIGNAAAGLVWGVGAVMLFPTQDWSINFSYYLCWWEWELVRFQHTLHIFPHFSPIFRPRCCLFVSSYY